MLDRGPQRGLRELDELVVEIGARADHGERHGQARLALPPLAQVRDPHEPVILVGEAALVDDQAGVDLAARDRVEDAVVAQLDDLAERGRGLREQQERGGVEAGNGDAAGRSVCERRGLAGDDERPHPVAERRACAQRAVAIAKPGERPDADLRQLELAGAGRAVQLLDVAQRRPHAQVGAHEPVHHGVERERVVGAGREPEAQLVHVMTSSTSAGSRACSAAKASVNIQRARSCSSTSFETTRTSTAGTPASRAARSTP